MSKHLFKNTLLSYKKNKIALFTLAILVFLTLGIFCLVNNMTTNITTSFNNIANQSNLHSFTSNELYNIGSPAFSPKFSGVYKDQVTQTYSYQEDISKPSNNVNVLIFGQWNDQNGNSRVLNPKGNAASLTNYFGLGNFYCETAVDGQTTVTRWYDIDLSPYDSTGLYQYYAQKSDKSVASFKVVLTDSGDTTSEFAQYFTNLWNEYIDSTNSTKEKTIWKTNKLSDLINLQTTPFYYDYEKIIQEISKQQKTIFSQISRMKISPLQDLLKNKYSDELDYQQFNSLNVTATPEKIFYKIIEANPKSTIDKVVLFEDKDHHTGYELLDQDQWAPYNSEIIFYNQNGSILIPGTAIETKSNGDKLVVPSNFQDVLKIPLYDDFDEWSDDAKYLYSQIMHIRFKRMSTGQFSSSAKNVELINNLAAINTSQDDYFDLFYQPNGIYGKYKEYKKDYSDETINFSANGTVVFNWTIALLPSTCTIANYTSFLSIVNPQHLNAIGKKVISNEMFTSFQPFNEWYKATNHTAINQQTILDWFNWLTYDEFLFWKNPGNVTKQSYKIPTNGSISKSIDITADEWKGISEDYLIACGGYNLIIWGCGISADFMYPIVELTRPSPNATNECLIYLNTLGYQSIGLSFVNSPIEQFLLGKFKPNVSDKRAAQIIDEINDWSKTNMIYPQELNSTYFNDDKSNVLTPSGMRIAFVNDFIKTINSITLVLCTLSIIIGLLICFIVIKKYIDKNRVNVGIMRANGFSKWAIACSLLPFALLPAIFGGAIAYFFSLFSQITTINIFSTYWTLPTPILSFNLFSLLACIIIPFIYFSLISFFVTFNLLKNNAKNLITSGSEYKTNAISQLVKQPFKRFDILTRFRASLAFSSIWRLAVLTLVSTIAMSSLTFAISTFNKLNESHLADSSLYSYNYAIQLATPTSSGGNYDSYDWISDDNETGFGKADPKNYIFNTTIPSIDQTPAQMIKPYNLPGLTMINSYSKKRKLMVYGDKNEKNSSTKLTEKEINFSQDPKDLYQNLLKKYDRPNFFFITFGDSEGQNQDLFYLKDRFSSQTILDYDVGMDLGIFGGKMFANSWEIALALMPTNNRNLAQSSFNAVIQKAGEKIAAAKPGEKWYLPILSKDYVSGQEDDVTNWEYDGTNYYDVLSHINAYSKYIYPVTNTTNNDRQVKYALNKDITGLITSNIKYYKNETEIKNAFEYEIARLGFNHEFLQLLLTMYSDPELCKLEYPINYGGTIPLNWDANTKHDETYTYINAKIGQMDSNYRFDSNKEISIVGLNDNSQYVSLLDGNNNDLKHLLVDKTIQNQTNGWPLIINSFVAHKYNLHVGNTIEVNITNTVDRFEKQIQQQPNDNFAKFRIVGITKGTANEKFYTSQYIANKLLGLPDGKSWNKTHKYVIWTEKIDENGAPESWGKEAPDYGSEENLPALLDLARDEKDDKYTIYRFNKDKNSMQAELYDDVQKSLRAITNCNVPIGFNGVFTTQIEGKPNTNVLSLYSYTGMYPGISTFSSTSESNKFAEILKQNNNLALANFLSGLNDPEIYDLAKDMVLSEASSSQQFTADERDQKINQFIDKLVSVYGPTTVVTSINGAIDSHALDQVYDNLITTFNTITNAILATIIPIAIVIIILISNLIIDDSKKKAMMLKALGYNNRQNASNFLSIYIPVIAIGLLLAMPIAYGICLAYNAVIIQTTNLLVYSIPTWWHYIASFGAISLTFVCSYVYGYVVLRKERLVDNLKIE